MLRLRGPAKGSAVAEGVAQGAASRQPEAVDKAGFRFRDARAFFDSVETEKRGKAPFDRARLLREALDRIEKRSSADRRGGRAP